LSLSRLSHRLPGREAHPEIMQGTTDCQPWIVQTWCVPPKADAEFVWRMEDVIQTSFLPYDPSVSGALLRRSMSATVRRSAAVPAAWPGHAGSARL